MLWPRMDTDRIQYSIWNKSSVCLDYIDLRNQLNQFEIFVSHSIHEKTLKTVLFYNKTVLIENHVNKESKSLEITI